MKRWILRFTLVAGLLGVQSGYVGSANHASAQSAQDVQDVQDAQEDRATAFQAVQGPQQESVPGGTLFIAGYGVVWALVFAYVFRLNRLSKKLAVELEELQTKIAPGASATSHASHASNASGREG